MSNAIRYDSLLVRALARELRDRLLGRPASALDFDRDRPAVSLRAGRLTLLWDAHPERGGVHLLHDAGRWAGNVALPRARVADVAAPPDERILVFRFEPIDPAAGGARALVLELMAPREHATRRQRALCEGFRVALDAYEVGELERALGIFEGLRARFPDDGPTRLFLRRCLEAREGLAPGAASPETPLAAARC